MPEVGQIIGEKYRLERVLGQGGMGSVFEAVHIHIGSKVAIKFLHPGFSENWESVQRFQREAQTAAAIGHDAIVHVQDIGHTDDGSQYLVMELLRGASLAERLAEGSLSIPMTAYVMCQVLSALHAAHEVGIIHRDMKPDNIFLVDTGAMLPGVKILDFGISRVTGVGANSEDVARLTRTGIVLGTPAYMSPEHARGRADIDQRSDIFSVGIIIYECLTGALPFNGDNYNAILAEIIVEEPPPPSMHNPDIPPHLEEVILRALEKDRKKRYQSAWELFDDMIPFVEESAVGRIPIPSGLESVPTRRQDGLPPTKRQPLAEAPTIASMELQRDTDYDRDTMRPRASSRLVPLMLVAGVVVVLVAAAAIGWAMLGSRGREEGGAQTDTAALVSPAKVPTLATQDAGTAEAGSTKATPTIPVAETARIDLVGVPVAAQILLDGTRVPHSDLPLQLTKGGPHRRLQVVLEGHEPFKRWINPNRNQKIVVTLEPLPSKEVVAEPSDERDERGRPKTKRPTTKRPPTSRPSDTQPTKVIYRPQFID